MDMIVANIGGYLASWGKSVHKLQTMGQAPPLRGFVFCNAKVKAGKARKASGMINWGR